MTKILTVDDEPQIAGFLERLFLEAGYSAISALDGMSALRQFYAAHPDIAIIDLMMPQMDGLELCRRIREISYIPIIVLTGLEQVGDKVNALNAGADDYVCKPVSARELLARVEACLRRSQWSPDTETSSVYSDAHLTIDLAQREVYVDGESRELTSIEYSLLTLLVQRAGEALSVEYLLTNVWGREYDTFDLVKWHISNLRKKLKSSKGQDCKEESSPIVTLRGYGYRYQKPAD